MRKMRYKVKNILSYSPANAEGNFHFAGGWRKIYISPGKTGDGKYGIIGQKEKRTWRSSHCRRRTGGSGEALQALFAAKGAQGYLVGGYVRNLLLGLPPADLDIASALLPEEVVQAAAAAGFSETRIVNARLGTVLLQMGGEKIEHTTFRRESYAAGGGHTPARVEIGATLLEDALRRDFAVNALYMRLTDGEVLDPTGRGLADIAARRLRSARACAAEMIRDDALRLLRLVRFACQLDFQIESVLFRAAREYAGQIHAISRERIAAEMQKILLSDTAYALPRRIPAAQRRSSCWNAWACFGN
ncbi:MAG: hypothetical protein V8Q43_04940 [Christensenellaceae bacterium]